MSDEMNEEMAMSGCCPNEHEHALSDSNVIADYGKCWRVRCETCRIIFSVSKAPTKKSQ